MARGRIITLTEDTTMDLLNTVLKMCASDERLFSELLGDEYVAALVMTSGEKVVRDYIMSMCKLGFLSKSSVTHVRFSTTVRGRDYLASQTRRTNVALSDL